MEASSASRLKLTNQEWKVYLDTRDNKNFQIARAAWIGDYADPVNFLDMFLSDAGERNDAGYNNPEFDELLRQAAGTVDPSERLGSSGSRPRRSSSTTRRSSRSTTTPRSTWSSPSWSGWEFNILDIHLGRYMALSR